MSALFRIGEDLFEMPANGRTVRVEDGQQRRPVGKTQRPCNLQALVVAGRQAVRLGIIDVLQAMFESAEIVAYLNRTYGALPAAG